MNPHTRYEIPVDHVSRWLALAAAILTMVMMVSVIWLAVDTPGEIIPGSHRPVHLPNAPSSAEIRHTLDAHNPVVQATEGRVR